VPVTTIVCARNNGESARQAYFGLVGVSLQNSSRGSDGVNVYRPDAASEVFTGLLGGGVI